MDCKQFQLDLSPHFKRKIVIQTGILKALAPIEATFEALL
jgi:hypothetical protein